jgi:L-rhamnose 1-dehydrogenase
MNYEKSFKGKSAVVTGGSRGIGRAIAEGLAARGADVCITYASHDREANETLESIKNYGVKGYAFKIDLSEINKVWDLANYAVNSLGKVDILVNNAGICPFKDFFEIDIDLFEKVWKVNVEGHFFLTQLLAKQMVKNKIKGRILFISSISAIVGGEFQAHYTTTKSALNGLMHSLAIVLGKYGILVNSLLPGTIMTDINKEDLSNLEKRKYMENRTAVKRLGVPADMVGPALFLVSDENTYVTGSELLADGGMLINLQ